MLPYPNSPGHYTTLHTVIPTTPTIIATINALIQNLKITNLHRHLLFDSTDPTLIEGVDDDDDDNTSLAGVQGDDTSLAGVPITMMSNDNDDDDSDIESDHNSVHPNEANDDSSKASVNSTRRQAPVHSMNSEPPHHPLDEDELDNVQLSELEKQVPVLCQSKRVSVPPSNYIP